MHLFRSQTDYSLRVTVRRVNPVIVLHMHAAGPGSESIADSFCSGCYYRLGTASTDALHVSAAVCRTIFFSWAVLTCLKRPTNAARECEMSEITMGRKAGKHLTVAQKAGVLPGGAFCCQQCCWPCGCYLPYQAYLPSFVFCSTRRPHFHIFRSVIFLVYHLSILICNFLSMASPVTSLLLSSHLRTKQVCVRPYVGGTRDSETTYRPGQRDGSKTPSLPSRSFCRDRSGTPVLSPPNAARTGYPVGNVRVSTLDDLAYV
jgi:hypothetical protein